MNHRRRPGRTAPPLLLNPVLEKGGAYPLLRLDERRREIEERAKKELYDFGTDVETDPPPGSEVLDLTELLGS